MEIIISLFIGLWLSAAGILAYIGVKKELSQFIEKTGEEK